MSRDFDDIYKKIDQSHKELYKQDSAISRDISNIDKNQEKILSEIKDLKKEVKNIGFKVDMMLEILNNFTIMLAEEGEEDEDTYEFDSGDTWVPKDSEDEEDAEDDWSNREDES
jgi:seryl-tRNA synthetase